MSSRSDTESRQIRLDFNPDLFNKLYWIVLKWFGDKSIRFLFIFGGSSASKTFSVVQATIVKTFESRRENTLVLRKYGSDIFDSIYAEFKSMISDWGLTDYFIIQQNLIINKNTGAFIRFRGLDDPEKVKGITKFKRVILEEMSQFDEADFKQIRKRLRGMEGQQIVGLFNPIRDDHWIFTKTLDVEKWTPLETTVQEENINERGNMVKIRTNYLDNMWIAGPRFVDQHVIDDFEHDKIHNPDDYRVYALGFPGHPTTGNEVYHSFKYSKHVKPQVFNPDINSHTTFDFNVVPYMTMLNAQITRLENGKWKVGFFNEFCLANPMNSTKGVCSKLRGFLEGHNFQNRLFYYGDYSGKNRHTLGIEAIRHQYDVVEQELKRWLSNGSDRVIRNPSVEKRIRFINACFEGRTNIEIEIDPSCETLIADLSYILQAADGGKFKRRVTDKDTKVSYEKYGHPTDALEYLICSAFAADFERFK